VGELLSDSSADDLRGMEFDYIFLISLLQRPK
jgi:hypothetical protein